MQPKWNCAPAGVFRHRHRHRHTEHTEHGTTHSCTRTPSPSVHIFLFFGDARIKANVVGRNQDALPLDQGRARNPAPIDRRDGEQPGPSVDDQGPSADDQVSTGDHDV